MCWTNQSLFRGCNQSPEHLQGAQQLGAHRCLWSFLMWPLEWKSRHCLRTTQRAILLSSIALHTSNTSAVWMATAVSGLHGLRAHTSSVFTARSALLWQVCQLWSWFIVECSGIQANEWPANKCGGFVGVWVSILPTAGGVSSHSGSWKVRRLCAQVVDRNIWSYSPAGDMEEEILNDSLPYLKELENKVGRKTPQSLLIWIKDAADCEDGCRSDGERDSSSAFNDNFSDKIRTLKQEMVTFQTLFPPIHLAYYCVYYCVQF